MNRLSEEKINNFKKELSNAEDFYDFSSIAEEILEAGDRDWAIEIHTLAAKHAKSWSDLKKSYTAVNVISDLKGISEEQYLNALDHLSKVYCLGSLAEDIQETINDKELIEKVFHKYLDQVFLKMKNEKKLHGYTWCSGNYLDALKDMSEKLEDKDWSKDIINRILSHNENKEPRFGYDDIAEYVSSVFNDKNWAKELYDKALADDINVYTVESIIENLGDKVWAKKLYEKIESDKHTSSSFLVTHSLADSIINNLNDKSWAKKLYQKAEEVAETPENYRRLANSLTTNLEEHKKAAELNKKGTFVLNNLDGTWGFRREGFGRVVYVSVGEVDTHAMQLVVDHIYTDTTENEDGEEIQDWAEYDPSQIDTNIAGELIDGYSFDELMQDTKLKEIEGSAFEKFENLLRELDESGCDLVLINPMDPNGPAVSKLNKKSIKKVIDKYKNSLQIYIREYDHVGDY